MRTGTELSKHLSCMITWEQVLTNGLSILTIVLSYIWIDIKDVIQFALTFLVAIVGIAYNIERWLYYRSERKDKKRERKEKNKKK